MKYTYKTQGTCSRLIEVEMDGNVLKDVSFVGGCNGNLKGICALCKGKTYEEISDKLEGLTCGFKGTSCPDQLVHAMQAAMKEAE